MRILVIQFAGAKRDRPLPRFEPQLGTLLALLKKREHDVSLVGMARFDLEAAKAALARALPQLVYADISGVCVDAARRTFEYVQQHEFLPIVTGGVYPSVDPAGSLSLPGVQAAAIGEPDASLVTYLERVKDPTVGQTVLGVWMRDERGLARPELPHLVEDLNSLPFAERDLFDYGSFVQRTGQVEIAVGRGCPQSCAYCINDWLEDIYENHGTWVRRRSPENVAAEINLLRERYAGVRTVRFLDHAFALDEDWLASFLEVYRQRCGLPFSCHLRLNAVGPDVVKRLAGAGCRQVDVEIISGSFFVRNEIFDMNLGQEQIELALRLLREARLATRAIVYLGAPYESEMSLASTRKLLLRCRPDQVELRPYYPYPGTRACDTSRDNGWLHGRGEEQFHLRRPGIDMPACRAEDVQAFCRRLRAELRTSIGEGRWRWWLRSVRVRVGEWFGHGKATD